MGRSGREFERRNEWGGWDAGAWLGIRVRLSVLAVERAGKVRWDGGRERKRINVKTPRGADRRHEGYEGPERLA